MIDTITAAECGWWYRFMQTYIPRFLNNEEIEGKLQNITVQYTVREQFWNFFFPSLLLLSTLSAAIPGGWPGDVRGNSAGFADFRRQFLARNGGIGPLLHFRGKIHGERPAGFVASPPSWKWKIRPAGTGYYRWTASKMATEKKVSVSYVSLVSVPFCWSS